jgi:hypothetical protein
MTKTAKIDDVKRPDKVTPSSTARPILVSDHQTPLSDPMIAPAGEEQKKDGMTTAPLNHTAKAVEPPSAPLAEPLEGSAGPATVSVSTPAEITSAEPVGFTPELKPDAVPAAAVVGAPEERRDLEAAHNAEEAAAAEAKAKRDTELEELIVSGKYAVPINAVQRRRSRANSILLCIVAILLAAALLDLIADVGIVHVPTSVPHTHFFSK